MERIQLTNQRSSELGFLRENKVRRGRDRRSLGLTEHQVLFWGGLLRGQMSSICVDAPRYRSTQAGVNG